MGFLSCCYRTNRYLSRLCLPFIYHDLNLIRRNSRMDTETVHRLSYFVLSPYWSHIRVVRAFVDAPNAPVHVNAGIESTLAKFLEVCQSITTLGLYYHDTEVQIPNITAATVQLMKNGQLSSIGIYSLEIINASYEPSGYREALTGPIELISAIAKSPRARKAIRRLDIVAPWIHEETWDLIRSEMTSLESMTIRRALRKTLKRVWEVDQQAKWTHNSNLTHLHLLNCQPACATHIPSLVGHFTSLKELTVSTCGQTGDAGSAPREAGWSKHPTALCNMRKPLEIFHVEHMEDWEIQPMGVIPTKTLIVTNVRTNHLFHSFRDDKELFPQVKLIRISPHPDRMQRRVNAAAAIKTTDETKKDTDEGVVIDPFEALCRARAIELQLNAEPIWRCGCSGSTGY